MLQCRNFIYRLTHQGTNRRIRDPYVRWCERRTPSVYLAEPSTRLAPLFYYFHLFEGFKSHILPNHWKHIHIKLLFRFNVSSEKIYFALGFDISNKPTIIVPISD